MAELTSNRPPAAPPPRGELLRALRQGRMLRRGGRGRRLRLLRRRAASDIRETVRERYAAAARSAARNAVVRQRLLRRPSA